MKVYLILLFLSFGLSCKDETDCSYSGKCTSLGCECFTGYATFYEDPNQLEPKCNYPLKKAQIALYLASFLSFGSHHVYCGNYYLGYIQFCFFCFSLSTVIVGIFQLSNLNTKASLDQIVRKGSVYISLLALLLFSVIGWYLWDIWSIVTGNYRDFNLQPLNKF